MVCGNIFWGYQCTHICGRSRSPITIRGKAKNWGWRVHMLIMLHLEEEWLILLGLHSWYNHGRWLRRRYFWLGDIFIRNLHNVQLRLWLHKQCTLFNFSRIHVLRGSSSTLTLYLSSYRSFGFILFGHQIDSRAFFFKVIAVLLDLHLNLLLPALLPELPRRVLEAATETGFRYPSGPAMSQISFATHWSCRYCALQHKILHLKVLLSVGW